MGPRHLLAPTVRVADRRQAPPTMVRAAVLVALMLCVPWAQAEGDAGGPARDQTPQEDPASDNASRPDVSGPDVERSTVQPNGTDQNATQDDMDQNATQDGTDGDGEKRGQDAGREGTSSMPWVILALLTILLFAIAKFGP